MKKNVLTKLGNILIKRAVGLFLFQKNAILFLCLVKKCEFCTHNVWDRTYKYYRIGD